MDTEPQTVPFVSPVLGHFEQLPHGEANLTPLAQLKRMQRVLYADVTDPDTDKRVRAMLACAWEKLEGRKACLTMKPAPKPIDVADLAKARARRREAQANGQPSGWRSKGKRGPGGPAADADAQAVQRDPSSAAQDRTDPATRIAGQTSPTESN